MEKKKFALSREWTVALAVLGGALVYKLVYLVYYARQMPFYYAPIGDSAIYLDWARSIAYSDFWGLREPFRVFYRAPLYPYLLALFLRVFGGALLPVYIFQLLAGTLNLLLVYLIARKLFSHWAGIAAMALGALYMPLMFKETKIVSITIVITFLLLAVWFLLRADERKPKLNWLLSGVMMGLSTLAWGGTMLLLPVAFLFWVGRRKSVRFACFLLLFAGWFGAILPATLHNVLVGNDMVLVNSNGGYTFYQGNNPGASGTIVHPPEVYEQTFGGKYLTGIGEQQFFDMGYAAKAMQKDSIKPSEASAFWMKRALTWMTKNPGQYLRLEFQKLVLLLSNHEFASNYFPTVEEDQVPVLHVAFVPFALILALGLVGMFFAGRRTPDPVSGLVGSPSLRVSPWPVYLVVSASALLLIVFYVGTRYRLPLVFPLVVFGGGGVMQLVGNWRRRRVGFAELAVLTGGLLLSWVFCYVPLTERQAFVTSLGYRNLGESYHRQLANLAKAKKAYDRAIKLQEDNNWFGHTVLATDAQAELFTLRGDVYFDAGLLDSAVMDYRQALTIDQRRTQPVPKLALAFYSKATRMLKPGSVEQAAAFDTALEYTRTWRQTDTTDASALAMEGDIYLARADTSRALASYAHLLAVAPRFAPASFVSADIYMARRDTARAEKVLADLTVADSLNAGAWLAFGDINERKGDTARARALYEQALVLDSLNPAASLKLVQFYSKLDNRDKVKGVALAAIGRVEKPKARLTLTPQAAAQYFELKLRLAVAYLNTGDWDLARKQADEVLKLAPANPTAQQLVKAADEKKVPNFILW